MLIENPKTYKGTDAENIFFRPLFSGQNAKDLGIRVIYNMPMPTTVQVWTQQNNVLQSFECGWNGGTNALKQQKTIDMHKVKAECNFAAEDYFSLIFEKIVTDGSVNMGDLTGTELEKAETELFRQAIAEGVRSTMWIGDVDGELSELKTFNGFLRNILDVIDNVSYGRITSEDDIPLASDIFKDCWNNASAELKALRSGGELVYFVSSDIYNNFIEELAANCNDISVFNTSDVYHNLNFRGIPIVEVPLKGYQMHTCSTFCLLTDRRNLVLALNTADMPENEVRMWYNPDEMQNRQRAVFLAGADVIDEKLVSICYSTF